MSVPDLAADLPPPRDDEPASLRGDIVDELADHLECALRRELLKQPGPVGDAEARVVEKFGDPRAVARRLWFDALREQIMSQRLILVLLVVLTLLCAGLFVFTWQSQAAQRALVEHQQAQTQALLEKLTELSNCPAPASTAPEAPAEWNRLTVKCVYDQLGGEPVEGVKIRVRGTSELTKGIPSVTETTDAGGAADFGLLLYGNYSLSASFQGGRYYSEEFSIRPGQPRELEIVCPRPDATGLARLKIGFKSPVSDRLWITGVVRSLSHGSNRGWTSDSTASVPFVRRPDGKVAYGFAPDGALSEDDLIAARQTQPNDPVLTTGLARLAGWRTRHGNTIEWTDTLKLKPGQYAVELVDAGLTDPDDPSGLTMLTRFDVPGLKAPPQPQFLAYDHAYLLLDGQEPGGSPVVVSSGIVAEIPIPPPSNLQVLDVATRLPQGMEVERIMLQFDKDTAIVDSWKSDGPVAFDLLLERRHQSEDGRAVTEELVFGRQIEGYGLRLPNESVRSLYHLKESEGNRSLCRRSAVVLLPTLRE